ncbi:MAG: hypothetical protein ACM3KR_04875 [Deltaproteobacteria bacterium]
MNNEIINKILSNANDCVKAFRIADQGLGYKKIIEFIENMQELIVQLVEKKADDSNTGRLVSDMNAELMQINQALLNKDGVLISDLLEFEIIPKLEAIKN